MVGDRVRGRRPEALNAAEEGLTEEVFAETLEAAASIVAAVARVAESYREGPEGAIAVLNQFRW